MMDNKRSRNLTILAEVICNRDVDRIDKLLQSGEDVNAEYTRGITLLHLAARSFLRNIVCEGSIKVFVEVKNQLMDSGDQNIDSSAVSDAVETQLRRGAEIVDVLLQHGADVNAQDNHGRTPLHLVASNGGLSDILQDLSNNSVDLTSEKPSVMLLLGAAAAETEIRTLELLLSNGANVNTEDNKGKTPLHYAVEHDSLGRVKVLLEHGAKANGRDKNGQNPLDIAVTDSSPEIVRVLLEHGADADAKNSDGDAPIDLAIRSDSPDKVMALLEYGHDPNKYVSLHIKSLAGFLDVAKVLVEHGANVDMTDDFGNTPLIAAAQEDSLEMVKLFLKLGANVNVTNERGKTALHEAASKKSLEVIKVLLEHGANVNITDNSKNTPLLVAVRENSLEMVEMFSKHGANVNITDDYGNTPLIAAAQEDSLEMVKLFLKLGANVNVTNECGKTALHEAASEKSLEVIKVLLEHGSNVNITDNSKSTPLLVAAWRDSLEMVEMFSKLGANVNITDKFGYTPLHIATRGDSLEIVKLLAKLGANLNVAADTELTPLHAAAWNGSLEMFKILLGHGANPNIMAGNGNTPLHDVVEHTKLESSNYGDVKAPGDEKTPPRSVSRLHNIKCIINLLIEHGANLEALNNHLSTPAHMVRDRFCCLSRSNCMSYLELVNELFSLGANFNVTDGSGHTAFTYMIDAVTYSCNNSSLFKPIVTNHIKKLIALETAHVVKNNRALFFDLLNSSKGSWDESLKKCKYVLVRQKKSVHYYYLKCRAEMEKLEDIRLFKNITLGSVLSIGDPVTLGKISCNVDFQLHAESEHLSRKFPVYSFLIKLQYQRASRMKLLCDNYCETSLRVLSSKKMNRECAYEILQYLSENDLENLSESTRTP